ncbi:MAG: ParB/RepB/Spo0J family partition protein [Minisyncoccia bacterium]
MPDKHYISDSIYWVEVERIKPNPFQPRKEFDEAALKSLAESIRQYGVLQPLTVTKKEIEEPGQGIKVEYELIAGERRLRAAKIAGVGSVPCVIRTNEQSDQVKLELAIIENLQREDLNPVDRAKAFRQLNSSFNLSHAEIGKKVGKSREYVSNTLRILNLPQDMLDALAAGEIVEGHTRPLLMLIDRPAEQKALFHDITTKRLNVRDSEQIARRIALERARKTDLTPELMLLERELSDALGTRVRIDKGQNGGKVLIEFFSVDDLAHIRNVISQKEAAKVAQAVASVAPAAPAAIIEPAAAEPLPAPETLERHASSPVGEARDPASEPSPSGLATGAQPSLTPAEVAENPEVAPQAEAPKAEEAAMETAADQDLYSVKNFTV